MSPEHGLPYSPIFGRMSWESIPMLHDPIVMAAFVGTAVAGLAMDSFDDGQLLRRVHEILLESGKRMDTGYTQFPSRIPSVTGTGGLWRR